MSISRAEGRAAHRRIALAGQIFPDLAAVRVVGGQAPGPVGGDQPPGGGQDQIADRGCGQLDAPADRPGKIQGVQGAVSPAEEEAARAAAAAQRDARLADGLEKDRLAREKQAPKALVIAHGRDDAKPPQRAAGAGKKTKGKPKAAGEPEVFTVKLPAPKKEARAPRK